MHVDKKLILYCMKNNLLEETKLIIIIITLTKFVNS